jgi:AraC-like DNA-binding protein
MMKADEELAKIDCFMIVFCQEGNITLNINGNQHSLKKDFCAILPPGTIVRKIACKQPYVVKIAAASVSFLTEILNSSKETWNIIHFLYYNPIHPIQKANSYKLYLYKELLITLIQEQPHAYSKQTRRFHFAGMFCEMMVLLNQMIPKDYEAQTLDKNRAAVIARDFIELVNSDNGMHRTVSYYADRLCYSPKYLSATVKQITGKSPLQIINAHAIKQIKYKIKHSQMSMKELADYFEFTNPSFFGKFVKMHIGMSPMQYRITSEDADE